MPTAITGATGQLGRLVINQLKEERVSLDDIARQAQPTRLHRQQGAHHHG